MANTANGKVVALGDHPRARARLSSQESAGVLRDCRELALTRIASSLSGMMDRIEDDLFELAEKTHDREAQNVYLDARAKARENRPLIEASFRSQFIDLFNRKVRGEAIAMGGSAPGASLELSLVNEEELEGSLAASDMARKLSGQCEAELYALSQRFGFLLERPELKDDANPLSPGTVCAALKDACDKIDTTFKVRMALLRQFEGYVAADLQRVYHDLNAHLVQRQILPEIRPVARKNPRGSQAQAQATGRGTSGTGGAPSSGAPEDANGPNSDIFQTLAKFLGTPQGGGAAPAGMPVPDRRRPVSAGFCLDRQHLLLAARRAGRTPEILRGGACDAERDPALDGRERLVSVGKAVRGGCLRYPDSQRLVGGA